MTKQQTVSSVDELPFIRLHSLTSTFLLTGIKRALLTQ
jgi:hypothetical protein